jgi:hypothetical protein
MKISVTVDLNKINKDKIAERTFKLKDGTEYTAKEYKFDVVKLKADQFVTEGAWGKMIKTHFVAEAQSKEEATAKKPSNFIGSGFRFEKNEDTTTSQISF